MRSAAEDDFIKQLKCAVFVGSVFVNPGGGTSTIVGLGEDRLSYIRGTSRMYLPYAVIIDVLEAFTGRVVATSDLKKHNPGVFDTKQKGHDCNCTVMFSILERMGLIKGGIQGTGRRGSPFFVTIR